MYKKTLVFLWAIKDDSHKRNTMLQKLMSAFPQKVLGLILHIYLNSKFTKSVVKIIVPERVQTYD